MWALFFLAKSYLFLLGYLRFDALLNLLFLGIILIPLPQRFRQQRSVRIIRQTLNIVLACLLFWHDSWLPPISRALDFMNDPTAAPTPEYLQEFLIHYLGHFPIVEIMTIILVGWLIARTFRKTITVAMVATVLFSGVASWGRVHAPVDENVMKFYATESKRTVSFVGSSEISPNFDILILQVCSLAWADLDEAGLRNHPFLRKFNILFTQFNSVTSYSESAAYRLLRASCGQAPQNQLYAPTRKECYLLDQLRNLGFKTYATLDHDGVSYDFTSTVREHGHMDIPLPLSGISIRQHNFDGTPIHDGYDMLHRWWQKRLKDNFPKSVLYYNTITLHEGAKWVNDDQWKELDRIAKFRTSTERLFESLQRFFDLLSNSDRNVVVIFVPEHGTALKGAVIQAPALREIPLPYITNIPVGVKFFGKGWQSHKLQRTIETPTSYQALAWLLAEFIKNPPFNPSKLQVDLSEIPRTTYLAENGHSRVANFKNKLYVNEKKDQRNLYGVQKEWIRVPNRALQGMSSER